MQKCIHILTHEYPPQRGGAGIYCREIALAASGNSISVTVWAPKESAKDDGVKSKNLPWRCNQSVISSWRLFCETRKFVLSNNTDFMIFHLAELGSSRAFLRFGWVIRKKLRFILTIHGSEILRFTRNPLEKWLFRKLLLKCEKIHVLSHFNKQKLIKFCPTVEDKICLIPGAPSSNLIGTRSLANNSSNENKVHILCVGRLHPRKGQDQILLALDKLSKQEQNKIVLRFVGPKTKPKFVKRLVEICDKLQVEVFFEGDCSDQKLSKLYSSSDIFILTSMPLSNSVEGFGFVYLEASSYGLPIIANRTGGVEDAVINGKTGLLVEPGDIEGLSDKLKKLVVDDKLREKIGKEGKRWAKNFTWDRVALSLYNSD